MENYSLTSVICIYCALVCCVSGQQTGALPEEENKKSSDDSKFIPITRESPKFSIGLGVLSPSYTQKFGDEGEFCALFAFFSLISSLFALKTSLF